MKQLIIIIFIILGVYSCAPKVIYKDHTEYINTRDSIYINNFIKDSIYVYKNGDTVLIERFNIIYKDKYQLKRDSIFIKDTINTISERKVVEYKTNYKGWFWFGGLLLLIIGYIFIKVRYGKIF